MLTAKMKAVKSSEKRTVLPTLFRDLATEAMATMAAITRPTAIMEDAASARTKSSIEIVSFTLGSSLWNGETTLLKSRPPASQYRLSPLPGQPFVRRRDVEEGQTGSCPESFVEPNQLGLRDPGAGEHLLLEHHPGAGTVVDDTALLHHHQSGLQSPEELHVVGDHDRGLPGRDQSSDYR